MMKSLRSRIFCAFCILLSVIAVAARPAACQDTGVTGDSTTGYRVHVISRSTQAVDYRRTGSTHVNLRGTDLMPEVKGEAKVESRTGRIEIDASIEHLRAPSSFGLTYLTY